VRGQVVLVILAGCGRIDFDVTTGPSLGDGGGEMTPSVISWVQSFAHMGTGPTHTTMIQAQNAGDAIVFHIECGDNTAMPTGVTITSPGWTFAAIGSLAGSLAAGGWGQTFGAIAPDTAAATLTVTWAGTTCFNGTPDLGDEFAGNDQTGGSITFDGHAEASGSGDPNIIITTGNARDAVWAGAASSSMLQGIGAGYTMGANDGGGDLTEYKVTTDPAGTPEAATFSNGTSLFVITGVSIKPAG
jgi:hypothetical protein